MLLERPAFSPKLDKAGAQKAASSVLKKNHWNKYEFSVADIFYVPHWFFSYDIYEQIDGRTNLLSSGFSSLNAFSNEIDKTIGSLAQNSGLEKNNDVDENDNVHIVSPRVGEEEAREIISVRFASQEETSKENVIISGLQLFFVPIWVIKVNLEGEKISLRVNAINGDIENKMAIPRREKGFSELTREMLEELSTPQGWIDYSKGAVKSISKSIAASAKGTVGVSGKAHFEGKAHIDGKADIEGNAHTEGKAHIEEHVEIHETAKTSHADSALSDQDVQVILLAVVAVLVILWAIYRF